MKTAACALIVADNRILLGKRSPTRRIYPDVWDIFGGHCEPGEAPEQTLARELAEELGISPIQWKKLTVLTEPNIAAYGHYQYHTYLVTSWRGTPHNRQPHEHTTIRWFSVAEALELELAHPDYPALFARLADLDTDS